MQKFWKRLATLAVALALSVGSAGLLAGCGDGDEYEPGEAIEDTGDAVEDSFDDAGDALEDMGDELD